MKSDVEIQKDVMAELQWQPFLSPAQIGVAVKDGVVTLSGQVDSYSRKLAAESAARKIAGVKAVAEDIQVGVSPAYKKTDAEIATAALNAMKWHSAVQEEKIKLKVEDGVITLDGEVEWEYQRSNAVSAVQHLLGVKSVINRISLKPRVSASHVSQKITSAFLRSASFDATKVKVEVSGSKVTLSGYVRSFAEKEDAERAAWNAAGVTAVESKILIQTPEFALDM